MLKANFYLNGKKITEPINYRELSIELNFDKDDPDYRGQVSINNWQIGLGDENDTKDGAKLIHTYINQGITGGVGIFEGVPFKIELQKGSSIDTIFNGYLDLTTSELTCDRINANAVESGGIDWLNDIADSFTFEYLATDLNKGGRALIRDNDYVLVPYVLSELPDTQQLFTLTLSAFVISQELIRSFQEWQEWSVAFTADYLEFGNLVTLILLTIKNILLAVALIKLIDQIIQATIQPIKYHAGMYLKELCDKGATHLGYTFKSSILESYPFNQWALLPESFNQYEKDPGRRKIKDIWQEYIRGVKDIRNSDRVGFYRGTFGQLLRELKTMFNAKIIVDGSIIRLERIDYNTSANLYQVPAIDKTDIPYRFNTEDFYSLYTVSFTTDLNDKNVYQNYVGTELQVITSPKVINNAKNILTKNTKINSISFARGARKDKLNFVERYVDEFISQVDKLVGKVEKVINAGIKVLNRLLAPIRKIIKVLNTLGIKLKANILAPKPISFNWKLRNIFNPKDRIGALLMENDFINIPKLVMLDKRYDQDRSKVKISSSNALYVNASYLYDSFHSINSFITDKNNQKKIYTIEVPFCYADYQKVKNSNIILDTDGIKKGEIISLKWNVYEQKAEITYSIPNVYTTNLKEAKILSDGR